MPPFVTAHTFCGYLRNLPTNTKAFLGGLSLCGKSRLKRGLSESEKKIGVTTHFSETTELKFGKKMPYIRCILNIFRIMVALLSLKNAWLPTFVVFDSNNPC